VKSDVDLKIPPKKEVLVYCPMSSKQHDMYEAIVNKTISDLLVKVFFSHFFTLTIT
jgi:ATP-dependent DNA helicase